MGVGRNRSVKSRVVLVAGTFAVLALAASCKRAATPCPQTFSLLKGQTTCTCAPSATSGSVWGVETYTTDSAVCAAAVHAGAVPVTGGLVSMKTSAGCPSYPGSVANGVTSAAWGSFGTSFYFDGHGTGTCTAAAAALGDKCPARFNDVPNAATVTDVACTCPGVTPGSVWGNGIYTTDSSICAAAVHAGEIPSTGGKVLMKRAPGCPSYGAATQNSVTSSTWATFASSFYFPAHGDGKCAATAGTTTAATKCPNRFQDLPNAATATDVTCSCAPGATGSLWGDGIYTRDSSICAAAVHAGAVPVTGGKVTLKAAPGCPAYKSGTHNGVKSNTWGKFNGSFYFPSKGTGTCG